MSIVTDALNRLQAERARFTRSEHSPPPSESPPSPKGHQGLSPPKSSKATLQSTVRLAAIVIVLAGIGVGAYFWGLTLVPDVAKVPSSSLPDHEEPEVAGDLKQDVSPGDAPPESAASPQEGEGNVAQGTSSPDDLHATPAETAEAVLPDDASSSEDLAGTEPQQVAALTSEEVSIAQSDTASPATIHQKQPAAKRASAPSAVSETETNSPAAAGERQNAELVDEATSSPSQGNDDMEAEGQTRTRPTVRESRSASSRSTTVLETRIVRAQYLIKKRRYAQAVTILQPLFAAPPDAWEPWFWLGTAYLGLEQFERAEEAFLEGLARNAAVPQLWVQRSLVSQQLGRYGEAVESLRQAELIAPELPEVQLNLAYSLEVQGHTKAAVEHYHAFLAITEGKKAYHIARKKVLDRILRLEAA